MSHKVIPAIVLMKYFVWKRNEGYIDVSTYVMPRNYTTGESTKRGVGAGITVTFERLGEFEDWEKAKQSIIEERIKCSCNYCTTWCKMVKGLYT